MEELERKKKKAEVATIESRTHNLSRIPVDDVMPEEDPTDSLMVQTAESSILGNVPQDRELLKAIEGSRTGNRKDVPKPTIIGGDFYIKLNIHTDCQPGSANDNPRATGELKSIMSSFGILDAEV
ncbi:unnamed protein product [Lepeophtheirus salmonis]|uniref:(salmon louse) hypothetical protein n=1 Tax=Lepeophtheirus salmonis TaxID=72036 RepID=A0A7R8HCP8_LEPSM|nr:unnamed protein product [Lepeophtheirus salmonis]CAF3020168.1 unnamed protein product [Lepeophtheirus salmonis]